MKIILLTLSLAFPLMLNAGVMPYIKVKLVSQEKSKLTLINEKNKKVTIDKKHVPRDSFTELRKNMGKFIKIRIAKNIADKNFK